MASARTSLRAKDAVEGTSVDGALATITEIEFVDDFNYGGRRSEMQAALRVKYDIEGFQKPWEQHYSVGPARNFEIIEGGNAIRNRGKAEGLNNGCNAYRFLAAAEVAEGYAGQHDEGSVESYEGARVRLGQLKYETVGGEEKDMVIIASFEAAAKSGKKGKSTNSTPAASSNVEDKTEQAILGLFDEDGDPIPRKDLATLIGQSHKKDDDVKAMMQLTLKDTWVGADERPFTWDRKKDVIRKKQ